MSDDVDKYKAAIKILLSRPTPETILTAKDFLVLLKNISPNIDLNFFYQQIEHAEIQLISTNKDIATAKLILEQQYKAQQELEEARAKYEKEFENIAKGGTFSKEAWESFKKVAENRELDKERENEIISRAKIHQYYTSKDNLEDHEKSHHEHNKTKLYNRIREHEGINAVRDAQEKGLSHAEQQQAAENAMSSLDDAKINSKIDLYANKGKIKSANSENINQAPQNRLSKRSQKAALRMSQDADKMNKEDDEKKTKPQIPPFFSEFGKKFSEDVYLTKKKRIELVDQIIANYKNNEKEIRTFLKESEKNLEPLDQKLKDGSVLSIDEQKVYNNLIKSKEQYKIEVAIIDAEKMPSGKEKNDYVYNLGLELNKVRASHKAAEKTVDKSVNEEIYKEAPVSDPLKPRTKAFEVIEKESNKDVSSKKLDWKVDKKATKYGAFAVAIGVAIAVVIPPLAPVGGAIALAGSIIAAGSFVLENKDKIKDVFSKLGETAIGNKNKSDLNEQSLSKDPLISAKKSNQKDKEKVDTTDQEVVPKESDKKRADPKITDSLKDQARDISKTLQRNEPKNNLNSSSLGSLSPDIVPQVNNPQGKNRGPSPQ